MYVCHRTRLAESFHINTSLLGDVCVCVCVRGGGGGQSGGEGVPEYIAW